MSSIKAPSFNAARTPCVRHPVRNERAQSQVCHAGMKELRDRIGSVKNTKKITDAMKLVAAAKVRRAQDSVVRGRPFSENLVKLLYGLNQRIRGEDVDTPLAKIRPVESVTVALVTGDRGLCGGYNNFAIKKAEKRMRELKANGIKVELITIGNKGSQYFKRRADQYTLKRSFQLGQSPTAKEAQAIADEIFAEFVSLEVDKVEMVYTKFQSLVKSDPVVQSLLPLTPQGDMCDIDGNCIDPAEDELFKLTTVDGRLTLTREAVTTETSDFNPGILFEQEPAQLLDALLPLYLNSVILRALQESLASELAARMNAMNSASDNAKSLGKALSVQYNRKRQAAITNQILEIVGGANAV